MWIASIADVLMSIIFLRQLLDPSETVLLLGFDEFYGEVVPMLHSEEGGTCWVWGGVKRRDPSSLIALWLPRPQNCIVL